MSKWINILHLANSAFDYLDDFSLIQCIKLMPARWCWIYGTFGCLSEKIFCIHWSSGSGGDDGSSSLRWWKQFVLIYIRQQMHKITFSKSHFIFVVFIILKNIGGVLSIVGLYLSRIKGWKWTISWWKRGGIMAGWHKNLSLVKSNDNLSTTYVWHRWCHAVHYPHDKLQDLYIQWQMCDTIRITRVVLIVNFVNFEGFSYVGAALK